MVQRTTKHEYRKIASITRPNVKSGGVDLVQRKDLSVYVQKKATTPFQIDLLGKEYRALSALEHPNIAKMVDNFINPEKLTGSIYLTFYDQGDLTNYVMSSKKSGKSINNDVAWHVFSNICAALAFCHYGIRSPDAEHPNWSAIIHRDMKTDNIFLHTDRTAPGGIIAILGDFDWSTNHTIEQTLYRRPVGGYQTPGDPRWLSPETPRYTMASDVWGLGAIMTCMCRLVESPEHCRVYDGVPGSYGAAMQRLVKRAVDPSPRERPSAEKLWQEIESGR